MNRTLVAMAALGALLSACRTEPVGQSQRKLSEVLGPTWMMAPLPDGKLGAGSVIQIKPVDDKTIDLRWLGNILDCGLPKDTVAIVSGDVPAITTDQEVSLDLNAAATLLKANASADLNAARTATLTIRKAKADSLNFLQFRTWFSVPSNAQAFNAACGSLTKGSDVYVIQEAFVVSDGSMSFKNGAGVKIAATPAAASPLKVGLDAHGKADADLTVSTPITFAIKRMHQVNPSDWATLGKTGEAEEENAAGLLQGKSVRNAVGF